MRQLHFSKADLSKLSVRQIAALVTLHERGALPLILPYAFSKQAERLPLFAPEAFLISRLLLKTWKTVGKEYIRSVKKLITKKNPVPDLGQIKRVKQLGIETGLLAANLVKPKSEQFLVACTHSSVDFYALQRENEQFSKMDVAQAKLNIEAVLAARSNDQMATFMSRYPERFVHPEIDRMVSLTEKAYQTGQLAGVDIDKVQRRLKGVTEGAFCQSYMEGLSNVHAARVWSGVGIMMAYEKGVAEYFSISMGDKNVCPVCVAFSGQVMKTEITHKKLMDSLMETDVVHMKEAFPFPRWNEVKDMPPEEVRLKGYLPPYHNKCRCHVFPAWKKEVIQVPVTEQIEMPIEREKLAPTELPLGWVNRGGHVEFTYNKWGTATDAKKWLKDNLTQNLNGFGNLNNVNNVLGPMQGIVKHAPLSRPLEYVEVKELSRGLHGRFYSEGRRIELNKELLRESSARSLDTLRLDVTESLRRSIDMKKERLELLRGLNWRPGIDDDIMELQSAILKSESSINYINANPKSRPLPNTHISDIHDSRALGTLVHEYGHAWHKENFDIVDDAIFKIKVHKSLDKAQALAEKYAVSEYSKEHFMECFAENFSAYMLGEVKIMHPDMIKFFDKQFPSLDFGHRLRPEIYK